jgi:hypothetical protein
MLRNLVWNFRNFVESFLEENTCEIKYPSDLIGSSGIKKEENPTQIVQTKPDENRWASSLTIGK